MVIRGESLTHMFGSRRKDGKSGMNKSAAKKMKQRSAGKPDIELGKRIRLRRVEQRISQAELGEQLGVSFQHVQPEVAAGLQQDQGSDRAASTGVSDGIDRGERRLDLDQTTGPTPASLI